MGEKESDSFALEYGNDAYQSLFESFYQYQDGREPVDTRFSISDVEKHDSVNYEFSAIFKADNGDEVSIIAMDGNWNGSVIKQWSKTTDLDLEPYEPTVYSFKPEKWLSPATFSLYLYWREQDWFKDLERGYNYDKFFAPGIKTNNYYRQEAAKRGLMIATLEDCKEYIARGPMTEEDRRSIEEAAAMMAQP